MIKHTIGVGVRTEIADAVPVSVGLGRVVNGGAVVTDIADVILDSGFSIII